jgi:hypothetical protein
MPGMSVAHPSQAEATLSGIWQSVETDP